MIPLPKLLNNSGSEVRRIRPVLLNITENIVPLSTANLTIKKEDAFSDRSYLELYNVNGSVGVYRARTPDISYRGNTITIGLEHAVCEIGDYIVRNDGDQEQKTLSDALSHFMSYYNGGKWQLGSVAVSGNVVVQDGYQDILSAINSAVEQVPGAMLAYNFGTSPWTLSVVSRGTTVSAEGRLSRNIEKCNVKRDDSSLCTRVWVEGLGGVGVMGHMDADTISTYGVVETQLSGSNYTQAQAQTVASAYLARYKRPVYSITINGLDFSGITGETLDRIAIGKLYRLAIPEDNVTIEEHVTSIRWDDVYGKPYAVSLTLAEQDNSSSITFLQQQHKQEQSNYSSLYNGYTSGDKWIWEKTGINELGQTETLTSKIQINAEAIQAEVSRATAAENTKLSKTTLYQTADSIVTAAQTYVNNQLQSYSTITQTSNAINAAVELLEDADDDLDAKISLVVTSSGGTNSINTASIVAGINSAAQGGGSYIKLQADTIDLDGVVNATEARILQSVSRWLTVETLHVQQNFLLGPDGAEGRFAPMNITIGDNIYTVLGVL